MPRHHHQCELSAVERDIAHFCNGFETFIKAVKTGSKTEKSFFLFTNIGRYPLQPCISIASPTESYIFY